MSAKSIRQACKSHKDYKILLSGIGPCHCCFFLKKDSHPNMHHEPKAAAALGNGLAAGTNVPCLPKTSWWPRRITCRHSLFPAPKTSGMLSAQKMPVCRLHVQASSTKHSVMHVMFQNQRCFCVRTTLQRSEGDRGPPQTARKSGIHWIERPGITWKDFSASC